VHGTTYGEGRKQANNSIFFLFQYSHQIIFIYLSSTITNNLIFFLFIFIYNLPSILLIYQISLKNEFLPSYNHSLSLL
jgi:hypothetical protein